MNLRALRTGALALIIAAIGVSTPLFHRPASSLISLLKTVPMVRCTSWKARLSPRGPSWMLVAVSGRVRKFATAQHKGDDLPSEIVIDSMGGTYGDYTLTVVGRAVYSEGENVFLFLDQLERSGRLVPLGKFLGKYTLRRAPGDTERHAFNWHASANSSTTTASFRTSLRRTACMSVNSDRSSRSVWRPGGMVRRFQIVLGATEDAEHPRA